MNKYKKIRDYILTIESLSITSTQAVITFLVVVWLRNSLEKLLEAKHIFVLELDLRDTFIDLLHVYASWFTLYLLFSIGLALFSGRFISKTNRIVLIAFPLIWLPPLLDVLLNTSGEIVYQYNFSQFYSSFFGLFNPNVKVSYVTPGVRIEIAIAVIISALYVILMRDDILWKRLLMGILAALWSYCSIFIVGFLPALWFTLFDTSQKTLSSISVLGDSNILAPFIWYLPFLFFVPFWIRSSSPTLWSAFLASLRPSRLFIYLAICNLAFLSGTQIGFIDWDWINLYDIVKLVILNISLSLAFIAMVVLNDWYDIDIDVVSNSDRPLVVNSIARFDYLLLGILSAVFSLLLAITLNEVSIYPLLTIFALGILYSVPPFRLRRFIGIGHILLAVIAGFVYLYGSTLVLGNLAYQNMDHNSWLALMIMFFFGVHFKDIKDEFGDKAAGVVTIATLIGANRAYWLVGTLVVISLAGLILIGLVVNELRSWVGLGVFVLGWLSLRNAEKTFWVMLVGLGIIFLPI